MKIGIIIIVALIAFITMINISNVNQVIKPYKESLKEEDNEYCIDCCFENNHTLCNLFQDIMNTICSTNYIYEQIKK